MSIYNDLLKQFHPDISNHPEAHERTILINKNKNNCTELEKLAISWGILIKHKSGIKYNKYYTNCLECDVLKIGVFEYMCMGRKISEQSFLNNGFKFTECSKGFKY